MTFVFPNLDIGGQHEAITKSPQWSKHAFPCSSSQSMHMPPVPLPTSKPIRSSQRSLPTIQEDQSWELEVGVRASGIFLNVVDYQVWSYSPLEGVIWPLTPTIHTNILQDGGHFTSFHSSTDFQALGLILAELPYKADIAMEVPLLESSHSTLDVLKLIWPNAPF